MSEWTYADVVGVLATVLAIVAGAGGAPYVVQVIKQALGLQGHAARALAVVVAALFGVLALVVDGTVGPEALTPANAGIVIGLIWAASQAEYQNIVRRASDNSP